MSHPAKGRVAVMLCIGLALLAVHACQDTTATQPVEVAISSAPTVVSASTSEDVQAVPPFVAQAPTSEQRRRIQTAMAATAWVGTLHTKAMREFNRASARMSKADRDNPKVICPALLQLATRYIREAESHAGVHASDDEREAMARNGVRAVPMCAGSNFMTVFGAPPLSGGSTATQETTVSEAAVIYMNRMLDSLDTVDYGLKSVTRVLNNVMASASGLNATDYAALAALANLAYGSAEYWNNCPLVECGVPQDIQPLSLFQAAQRPMTGGEVARVAGTDVAGCVGGIATKSGFAIAAQRIPVFGLGISSGVVAFACASTAITVSSGAYVTIRGGGGGGGNQSSPPATY